MSCRFTQVKAVEAYEGIQVPQGVANLVQAIRSRGQRLIIRLAPKIFILVKEGL